jgi:hypothetical protein
MRKSNANAGMASIGRVESAALRSALQDWQILKPAVLKSGDSSMLSLAAKVVFEPGDTQSSHDSNRAVFEPGSVQTGRSVATF